jgi:UDP-4-amino-4,6-dideoxy-N-acetyl-beta-L-altrosamine transaminase
MIPYGRQEITQTDIDAVTHALQSDFLTQGPCVPQFEQAVIARVGAKRAVAVNSATSALHIACLALELGPGDWLWTVPNTFVASANCGRYCGAEVDFVDIDPKTWNLSVVALKDKLVLAEASGRLPKVVVPVHFAGQPTEQQVIRELADTYGFKVVEDASHAIGASRAGEAVGSCRWSDITVFSFHPVKVITSAEGGMALTNDAELAERMAMLRTHGITRDPARFLGTATSSEDASTSGSNLGPCHYEQQLLGFNYRMTDVHAALGTSQLERVQAYVERRNMLARRYDRLLSDLPLQLPTVQAENRSSFHLYVVRIKPSATTKTRREVFEQLRGQGIGANVHYPPVHLQPYYRARGFACGQFAEAEAHGKEALTLPLYPGLTEAEQDRVVDAMRRVLRHG